jgi:hypothetical protein
MKYWKNVFKNTLYLSEFKPDLPYPKEGSGNGGLVNFKIGETDFHLAQQSMEEN